MSEITMSQNAEIDDPKLRKIAIRVVRQMELAVDKVAANGKDLTKYPLSTDPKSTERILASRFQTLAAAKRQTAGTQALARINAAPALKKVHFGELAGIDLSNPSGVDVQARAIPLPASLKFLPAELNALTVVQVPAVVASVVSGAPAMNRLQFRIHKVKCLDETGSWWVEGIGDDEIDLGGTTVDESGDIKKLAPFRVGSSFNYDKTVVFSPPRIFSTFNLTEGSAWPKSYFMTLILAEIDMGGLPGFISDLEGRVKTEVLEALVAAGLGIGASGGPVGAVVGAAVGFVVAHVFEFIKRAWEDDVFDPVTARINVPSALHRWPGGKTDGPEHVATFAGHGGRYQLTFDWRLVASAAAET